MKLTEIMVAVIIFLIASTVFSTSLINVRRSVRRSEDFSKKAIVLLDTDKHIRNEINKVNIPFWKSFDRAFEKEKVLLEEKLKKIINDEEFEIVRISSVYDKKRYSEGIKVEWKFYGREYICQEFIKQRIVNGKE